MNIACKVLFRSRYYRKLEQILICIFCLTLITSCIGFQRRDVNNPNLSSNSYPFRNAKPDESPRINQLRVAIKKGLLDAEALFWREIKEDGTPIIEPLLENRNYSIVTFVWHGEGSTKNVAIIDGIATAVGGVEPAKSLMSRIEGSDVWYRSYVVRNDAQFRYWLSPNDSLQSLLLDKREGNEQADPLNPNRTPLGISYVELANAPSQEVTVPNPQYPSGNVKQLIFESEILDGQKNIWVYTPPGYDPEGPSDTYPLIVAMGGMSYVTLVPVPIILDNLIASHKIPPAVAIVVSGTTTDDLVEFQDFTDFVAEELVPWANENYRTVLDPSKTVIGGSSRGGLASAFTAFRHPDVFGNALLQSASLWWSPKPELEKGWLVRQFRDTEHLPIVFFQEVGLMEADVQRRPNLEFRNVLQEKGYKFFYQEQNHSHTYVHWKGSFGDGLVYLMDE